MCIYCPSGMLSEEVIRDGQDIADASSMDLLCPLGSGDGRGYLGPWLRPVPLAVQSLSNPMQGAATFLRPSTTSYLRWEAATFVQALAQEGLTW